ncbi:unnamed protein product [Caenorhabditis sp. 36 PRJEB53466]|nr:unnamed protein product [Caenorhabditis sp. 36 PRJEB53466]
MTNHRCSTCGKRFELKSYRDKHEKRMHKNGQNTGGEDDEPESKSLKCSMCDKTFPRLSHLQRHQMTHLNVRNFACAFCDEKFVQKAHLTRHVARKHPNECGQTRSEWFACKKCGKLIATLFELNRHQKTAHRLLRCKKCSEVIEGHEAILRRHQMMCRNESNICAQCGASFARPADLKAHQTTCLNKVAFVCVPCEEYFKQRVQLDRHINRLHFRSAKCSKCELVTESPVQNARHALECSKIVICGYCNKADPEPEHIAENHWKKLKRAVKVRIAKKEAEAEKKKKREVESDNVVEGNKDSEEEEEEGVGEMPFGNEHFEHDPETRDFNDSDDLLFDSFAESTSSAQLDFSSSAFAEEDDVPEEYLTFSICPKGTDLSYEFRGRLPQRLADLFPELETTSIVLLNCVAASRTRITVQVPVHITRNGANEEEMRGWIGTPIVLD